MVKLKALALNDIRDLSGKNAIVIFSNGQIKWTELPNYGQVELTVHEGKVKLVEEKEKHLF